MPAGHRAANILDVQWAAKRVFNVVPASDSDIVLDIDENGSCIVNVRELVRVTKARKIRGFELWGAKTPSVSVEVSLSVAPAQ